MDIDKLTKLTLAEKAAFGKILVVAEAIQAAGECPAGHLYQLGCAPSGMDIHTFESIIDKLIMAKLVKRSNHMLTWIGPVKGVDSQPNGRA